MSKFQRDLVSQGFTHMTYRNLLDNPHLHPWARQSLYVRESLHRNLLLEYTNEQLIYELIRRGGDTKEIRAIGAYLEELLLCEILKKEIE